jgi:uncharacterized protein YutD
MSKLRAVAAPESFEEARLKGLLGKDSSNTSPLDALKLAEDYIRMNEGCGCAIVVIEKPSGGVATFYSHATNASANWLLDQAKLDLLLSKPE